MCAFASVCVSWLCMIAGARGMCMCACVHVHASVHVCLHIAHACIVCSLVCAQAHVCVRLRGCVSGMHTFATALLFCCASRQRGGLACPSCTLSFEIIPRLFYWLHLPPQVHNAATEAALAQERQLFEEWREQQLQQLEVDKQGLAQRAAERRQQALQRAAERREQARVRRQQQEQQQDGAGTAGGQEGSPHADEEGEVEEEGVRRELEGGFRRLAGQ